MSRAKVEAFAVVAGAVATGWLVIAGALGMPYRVEICLAGVAFWFIVALIAAAYQRHDWLPGWMTSYWRRGRDSC